MNANQRSHPCERIGRNGSPTACVRRCCVKPTHGTPHASIGMTPFGAFQLSSRFLLAIIVAGCATATSPLLAQSGGIGIMCESGCLPTWGVDVTPATKVAGQRLANTTGHSAGFTIENTGSGPDSITVWCTLPTGGVTCGGVSDTVLHLASREKRVVYVMYNVGAVGTGTVKLKGRSMTAEGMSDTGSYTVSVVTSVQNYVLVSPRPGTGTVRVANSGPYTDTFTVRNNGSVARTFTLQRSCLTAVGCVSGGPTSVAVPGNSEVPVTLTYNTYDPALATISLAASYGTSAYDIGSRRITVQLARSAPQVQLLNANADNVDRSLCLTSGAGTGSTYQCGDLLVAHEMPAYQTMGRDRAPALIYNSQQAFPKPTVQALVTLGGDFEVPLSVTAELWVNTGSGFTYRRSATWQPWGMYNWAETRAIGLVYGGDFEPTGAHPYQLRVRSNYPGSSLETVLTGKLLVVNRSSSPFGRGWGLAGLESILIQSDNSMYWWGGDGSSKLYSYVGTNTWIAPPGAYRDTLRYDPGTNEYFRVLRHGVRVTYSAAGRHIRTTNRTGQTTTFAWSGSQLSSITVPPAGQTATTYSFTYDPVSGNLDRITDPAGRVMDLTHAGGLLTSISDPDTVSNWFEYFPNGHLKRQLPRKRTWQATGWTNYGYIWGVRLTRAATPIGPVGGSDSAITVFEPWDERTTVTEASSGNVAIPVDSIFTRIRGPRVGIDDDARFYVDRWGAPVRIVDPLGLVTLISRDSAPIPALVTKVQYPNGRIVRLIYNDLGNLLQMRDSTKHLPSGAATRVTTWGYNWPGEYFSPSIVTDASGISTSYSYTTQGLTASVTEADGHKTGFAYVTVGPLAGLLSAVTDSFIPTWDSTQATEVYSHLTTQFGFNLLGNVVAESSPAGRIRNYTRNSLQLVTDAYDPAGHRTSFTYDGFGRATKTLEHVHLANPGYPADSGFTAPLVTETRRLVDVVDQVIDPRLVARKFDYDEADRLIAERDEANVAETHYLDAAGLADSTRRRTGLMVGYQYDIAGRLVQTRWAGTYPGLSDADSVRYTLNTAGQITSAVRAGSGTTPGSTITRTYAPTGELLSESGPTGTITYGYDAGGRRAWYRVGAPNNTALSDSITYTYNAAGTLARIEARWRNPGGGPITRDTVDFMWDRAGRRDQLRYSNGAIVKFAYDADGALRLMCSNHTHPLGQPDAFEFTLFNEWIDGDGMIRAARTKGAGLPPGCQISDITSFTHANVYGVRHQLLQQTANTEVRKYRYDGSGNMRKSHEALMVKAFQTPNGSNRVATYTIAPTGGAYDTKSLTYLADGSRSKESICATAPCATHDRQYLYDGLGRTIGTSEYQCVQWFGNGECKVTGPNVTATTCLYDALGRTYKACGNGGPILGFDGTNVTRTDSDANAYGWTIVHGPGVDDPLMAFRGQSSLVAFYLTDGGGRQYGVANRNGSDYSSDVAFLEGAGYAGGVSSSEGFGAQRDATPSMRKLSFFRNRVYDQATGRWTQEDPIGVAGGVNLYQFNGNNPITFTDPFGLCPCSDREEGWADTDPGLFDPVALAAGGIVGGLRAFGARVAGAVVEAGLIPGGESAVTGTVSKAARLAANKVRGDAFRDQIADGLEAAGRDVQKEVAKRTPFGRRNIDIEVSKGGKVLGGIETKTGKSPYILRQRVKDAYLRLEGYIVNVVRDK